MLTVISWLLASLAIALAIPTAVLCLEIITGVLRPPTFVRSSHDRRDRVAVLVPAHNESTGIAATLKDVKEQLRPGDRLLVVADNCIDETASVARLLTAEVVERDDSENIGKGFALDWGLRHLDANPPDIVVMIDADCRLAKGTIDDLASVCAATARPVQGLYLMTSPDVSKNAYQVAEFAWRVKNLVRPLGLATLGLPSQLMGTGMAFPWKVIRSVDLASASIVEDLKLGFDLTAAGHPPLFCPSACVTSQFAGTALGAATQRRRWEHGHVATILKTAPRFLRLALTHGNLTLLALTLDLTVPPLALLILLLVLILATAGTASLLGLPSIAAVVSATCLVGSGISLTMAWAKYGRDVLPPRAMLSIPLYVLAKLALYKQLLSGTTVTQWIRTERTKS